MEPTQCNGSWQVEERMFGNSAFDLGSEIGCHRELKRSLGHPWSINVTLLALLCVHMCAHFG